MTDGNNTKTSRTHDTIVVTSPAQLTDEEKNQDRAVWLADYQTACVCDGTTSSPFAAEAADLSARYSPLLFEGDLETRLTVLADLLKVRRSQAQGSDVRISPRIPESLRTILTEAAHEKLAHSFQTTLVAAKFFRAEGAVAVRVIKCGDSEFFAFSPEGHLLMATGKPIRNEPVSTASDWATQSRSHGTIRFGPGDKVLVKAVCQASDRLRLAKAAGIEAGHAMKWEVCEVLDQCTHRNINGAAQNSNSGALWLRPGELLLVPEDSTLAMTGLSYGQYRQIRYSTFVRTVKVEQHQETSMFDSHGSVTPVLPDSFHTGAWTCSEVNFPPVTNFLLCSDGFYTCFKDATEMWDWLGTNRDALGDHQKQQAVLNELHAHLHAKETDDDISFAWIRLNGEPEPDAGRSSNMVETRCKDVRRCSREMAEKSQAGTAGASDSPSP